MYSFVKDVNVPNPDGIDPIQSQKQKKRATKEGAGEMSELATQPLFRPKTSNPYPNPPRALILILTSNPNHNFLWREDTCQLVFKEEELA